MFVTPFCVDNFFLLKMLPIPVSPEVEKCPRNDSFGHFTTRFSSSTFFFGAPLFPRCQFSLSRIGGSPEGRAFRQEHAFPAALMLGQRFTIPYLVSSLFSPMFVIFFSRPGAIWWHPHRFRSWNANPQISLDSGMVADFILFAILHPVTFFRARFPFFSFTPFAPTSSLCVFQNPPKCKRLRCLPP